MDALTNWFSYVQFNFEYILEATIEHAQIVLTVVVLATIFSVLLGVVVHQRPVARTLALTISGIFLTIPSLALFAIFIPIVGIGDLPAMIALFLYSILPVLRNTVTGLDSVSPAVVESAKGMGMTSTQQLLKVRMPLALPVILAGVRISTLLATGIASIAVLVGGGGLGSYIASGLTRMGQLNASNSLYVGVVVIVLLGLTFDAVLALFQRLGTPRGLRV